MSQQTPRDHRVTAVWSWCQGLGSCSSGHGEETMSKLTLKIQIWDATFQLSERPPSIDLTF